MTSTAEATPIHASNRFLNWLKRRWSRAPITFVIYTILAIWAAISLLGFSWVVLTSLKTNQEMFRTDAIWGLPEVPQWDNYVRAWTRSKMGNYIINSVWLSVATVLFIDLISSMAAYILARFRFAGNKLILGAFILGSAIPMQLIAVPLYLMFSDLKLLNNLVAVGLVYAAVSLPFTVFILTGFFRSLPSELEDAAVLDGASEYGVFWRVMLPLSTPGLITVTIFNFLGVWNEYMLALMLINEPTKMTIPLGLYNLKVVQEYSADWVGLFAGFVMILIPTLVLFFILQERVTEGMTVGALKG